MIPENLVVETARVLLRPMEENDYTQFLQLAQQDIDMWYYFSVYLGDPAQLRKWMDTAFADKTANTKRPFTIIEKASRLIAGSSSLGNISIYDGRAGVGWGKDSGAPV